MRFLARGSDNDPFRPTECWLVSDGGLRDVRRWHLTLGPPPDDSNAHHLRDFKRWMLFGNDEQRTFTFRSRTTEYSHDLHGRHERQIEVTDYREFSRSDVLQRYLGALLSQANVDDERVWVLMPAIADSARRKRYLDTLRAAKSDIRVLPEPEMVIEYFRLVRQELEVERGRTHVFLVVDVGASTCNMTFVLSRRDEKIVDIGSRQRDQRLRAGHADSNEFAGRWVDEQLAAALGQDLEALPDEVKPDLIRRIEQAKIRASETGEPTALSAFGGVEGAVSTSMLTGVANEMWEHLEPLYDQLAHDLYGQMTGTPRAQELNAEMFERLGVGSAADIYRVIDTVILAGGTSQLPGFEQAMRGRLFPERDDLTVLRVGPAFATAAAVGAMAHVLHQQNKPPRWRLPDPDGRGGTTKLTKARFDGALSGDVVLRWDDRKRSRPGAGECVLLEAGDPFTFSGGSRPVEGLPAWSDGSTLRAQLALQPSGVRRRRRRPRHDLTVDRSPPTAEFWWDAEEREARLTSKDLRNARALYLDAKLEDIETTDHPIRRPEQPRANEIEIGEAREVVIDLGMSKTVVIRAEAGYLDIPRFERTRGRQGFRSVDERATGDADSHTEPESAADAAEPPPADFGADEVHAASGPPEPQRPAEPELVEARAPASTVEDPGSRRVAALDVQRIALEDFGAALKRRLESAHHPAQDDLVALVLAMLTRPFVLLAGPPGCGKSTLVRTTSQLLGLGDAFEEIQVQAHWRNDDWLRSAPRDPDWLDHRRLLLLDEVNLSRPEWYLWSLVNRSMPVRGSRQMPLWLCGTLNIDDQSRPPSPKVIDRGFILEVDAPPLPSSDAPTAAFIGDTFSEWTQNPLDIPEMDRHVSPAPEIWARVLKVVRAMHDVVRQQHLRQDLLPSHRALDDIRTFLGLRDALANSIGDIFSAEDALDRALVGRILVKLTGSTEQVEPVVGALEEVLSESPSLHRSRRRLALARSQTAFGFISPWQ